MYANAVIQIVCYWLNKQMSRKIKTKYAKYSKILSLGIFSSLC